MKKLALISAALIAGASCAFAFPKAIYVKQGDTYSKYNFGVASDLVFSNGGKTLAITGYGHAIDLDKVDYISFSAPVEDMALSPSQQKQKLVDIGEEVNAMVNLHDNAGLLNMVHIFFDHYEDASGKYHHPVVEFEVPEEYWDVHGSRKSPMGLVKSLMKLGKGEVAAARTATARATDLYRVEDYFGIYTANYDKEEWEKTAAADYLELRYRALDGDNYVVRLEASGDYTTWETKDFQGRMPSTMTVTFRKGNEVLATTVISSKLVQDENILINVDFNANGYNAVNKINIVNDKVTDDVRVTINGKKLCNVQSVVYGKNLLNYDEMYDDVKEATHYHDADDNCCGDNPGPLVAHFIRANTQADVIGRLQATGRIYNFSKMYDVFAEEDDDLYHYEDIGGGYELELNYKILDMNSDKSIIDVTYYDIDVVDKRAAYLNNYSDVYFSYDNDGKLQGYLGWETDDDSWENNGYYDTDYAPRYARTIVNGYLVDVNRETEDYYYDENANEYVEVLTPWRYSVYNRETGDRKYIEVPESEVIMPSIVRHHYYETVPQLVFPDLTSFMFEDFFDEVSFKKLINDYEDIVDTYMNITGQDKDNEDW